MILIFISSCSSCGFSERCHRDFEKKRISRLSEEERISEKQNCITNYQQIIKNTNHEKKQCDFWKCVDGKEDLEKRLKDCIWRIENIRN